MMWISPPETLLPASRPSPDVFGFYLKPGGFLQVLVGVFASAFHFPPEFIDWGSFPQGKFSTGVSSPDTLKKMQDTRSQYRQNFEKRKVNQSRLIWNNIKITNFSYSGVFKFGVFKIKSCSSQFITKVWEIVYSPIDDSKFKSPTLQCIVIESY